MTGQRVGNWILGEELGRGPNGVVYKATAIDNTRLAAVKVLHLDPVRGADYLAKFPAEMLAFHRLNHPNIVQFYDAGSVNGCAWYATEFVDGTDCATLLKARTKKADEPGLNWKDEVLAIAVQAARALKHGHHRSILHRNLKPSNLIVMPNGVLKVADFGVAKLFHPSPLALPADPMGTAGFLAPEHFNGKPLTRRSDLYSLGGVLYALLAGRPPFTAATTAEFLHKHCYTLPDRPALFVSDLPPDFDDLICALLAKDPTRRPGTAAAIVEVLDQIRGKVERKGKSVPWPVDPGDASGPMPALTDDATASESDDSPRPLMSRPLVVIPLFLLVVGLILLGIFWPRPTAEDMIEQARTLLKSDDPADWDRAWDDHLEPLSNRYPDSYADEVAAAKTKIADRRNLKKAIDQGVKLPPRSDAERLYQRGVALAQVGELAGAKLTWEQLVRAFGGIETDARWVKLAEAGLAELARAPAPRPGERLGLAAALDRARTMKTEGKASEAAAILDALEQLYRDDPAALDQVRAARR